MMSVILTAMPVSTRKFIREFPIFREQAEKGQKVVIESRDGMKFVFHRIGAAPRPRRVEKALPLEITDRWDTRSAAISPGEWKMNE
jgi:hypothetical protein